jgi:hypothetical protein
MLNRSRRAKSSRLQNLVRDKLLKAFRPHLRKKDVQTPLNGVNGPDIVLSRIAVKLIPWNFEVKNRNQIKTVYDWMKQASKNTKLNPVVVMKMNTRKPLAVIDLDTFIDLIK